MLAKRGMFMIHSFHFDGLNIVLDVNSGALHLLDELASKILEYYPAGDKRTIIERLSPAYGREQVLEACTELEELRQAGLLYTPDAAAGYRPPGDTVVKAMCLHLAHDCNLRCRYCFAGQGPFGGDRSLMPFEVGRAALDFLLERSGPRRHIEVDFFGGEPLLNFKVLRRLVDYGRREAAAANKEIKFTVTTNAVLLDEEITGYLYREGLSVILSLDGRPHVHDAMRPFPGGAGSYELVSRNILRFLDRFGEGDYYVRGTFTRHNLDFAADVLHLVQLGIRRISLEPVVGSPAEDYTFREEDLPQLYREYEKLARELLASKRRGQPVDFFHFNVDLDGGPCLKKRLAGCGAGNEYVAVTPGGDIYPCHQFVGLEEFKLGNVQYGQLNRSIRNLFRRAHIYNKDNCRECWAKFFCSGGCHANAYFANGSIYKPYQTGCSLMQKRLECALYLKAREILDASS